MSIIDLVAAFHEGRYMLEKAEGWDNVGLLYESSGAPGSRMIVANEISHDVVDEALATDTKLVYTYHPILFSGTKRIGRAEAVLRRLVESQISVFCPHTALDNDPEGFDTWFRAFTSRIAGLPFGKALDETCAFFGTAHLRYSLCRAHTMQSTVDNVLCAAGSGFSLVRNFSGGFFFTGEMSHHSVLAMHARDVSVVLTEHTNIERKFLRDVLCPELQAYLGPQYTVFFSKADRDPISFWSAQPPAQPPRAHDAHHTKNV